MLFTVERALRSMTMLEVADLAGVEEEDVYDVENRLEDVRPSLVLQIAGALGMDLARI